MKKTCEVAVKLAVVPVQILLAVKRKQERKYESETNVFAAQIIVDYTSHQVYLDPIRAITVEKIGKAKLC
jgi:hypothetical protein